jgi:hypothetical protein
MGWASGSQLAQDIWDVVRPYVPAGRRRMIVARSVIDRFQELDCDTIPEAEQLCADAGYVYDAALGRRLFAPLPVEE